MVFFEKKFTEVFFLFLFLLFPLTGKTQNTLDYGALNNTAMISVPRDETLPSSPSAPGPLLMEAKISNEFVETFSKLDSPQNEACRKLVQFLADPTVTKTHGFSVLREGNPIFESYTDGKLVRQDTKLKMFSMSKSIHIALMGMLNKGIVNLKLGNRTVSIAPISLNAPLKEMVGSKYGGSFGNKQNQISDAIQIGHLLRQSTGIKWCELENCGGATSWLAMSCTEERKDPGGFVMKQGMSETKRGKPVIPGDQFDYSSGNMVMVGEVIRKIAEDNNITTNDLYGALLARMGVQDAVVGKASGMVMGDPM